MDDGEEDSRMSMSLDEIARLTNPPPKEYDSWKRNISACSEEDTDNESRRSTALSQASSVNEDNHVNMINPGFQQNVFRPRTNNRRRNWHNFRGRRNFNRVQKSYNGGLPFISVKRKMSQNRGGRMTSYMRWRQRAFYFMQRNNFNNFQLSSRNLNRFNNQYPQVPMRRGPGSVASQGSRISLCSRCSNTSFRSNRSFRSIRSLRSNISNRSNRSFISNRSSRSGRRRRRMPYRPPSRSHSNSRCWSRSAYGSNQAEQFICYLNQQVQKQIRELQESKEERIRNSMRETLVDDVSMCKPVPKTTGITLNHRFKQFIINLSVIEDY